MSLITERHYILSIVFRFANPGNFLLLANRFLPWLWFFSGIIISLGLYLAFTAPADYQQGFAVRIMYIHVPFAWMSMLCYSMMALFALVTLIWRHSLAEIGLRTSALIGSVFTLIALLTGCIWAKPMWGVWWVWDARLVSMFVLFLMYLGIVILFQVLDNSRQSARSASVIALIGFIDIPIIKFSVDWWNTLHQPASVFRLDGIKIHPDFLLPLFSMALGIFLLLITLVVFCMRTHIIWCRIYRMRLLLAMWEEPSS